MRRHVLITLKAATAYAVKMRLTPDNPCDPVPIPAKARQRSDGVSAADVAKFLTAAEPDRYYAMYVLAVDSGLRQGELLALTWADVDFARGTVRVNKSLEEVGGVLRVKEPKTRSSVRVVDLLPATVAALTAHRERMTAEGHGGDDAPVFCGVRRGQHLRKSDVYRLSFAPALRRAGLKFRFHDLRHASASLLLADGLDVKTVQARMGHSAAAITMDVYAHAMGLGQRKTSPTIEGILAGKGGKGD